MLEVFAGGAVLTSVAKQFGLNGIAVAKKRKQNARSTIFQLDLLKTSDQELLWEWLASPLLLYVHFAPVCKTADRAREIPLAIAPNLPSPLRTLEFPLGLPSLSGNELQQVELANTLFGLTCEMFTFAVKRGKLATIESPRGSFFWFLPCVLQIMRDLEVYATDFQACMYGSARDKWMRILASFSEITAMDVKCDRTHVHHGWNCTTDDNGKKVWATSQESQYPQKLCVALIQLVLQAASAFGIVLQPATLQESLEHPLNRAKTAQVATGHQPRGNKLPPLVPTYRHIAYFFATRPSDIPCSLMAKLDKDITLFDDAGQPCCVPKGSRLLRAEFVSPPTNTGVAGGAETGCVAVSVECGNKKMKVGCDTTRPYKAVFGLPWDCESFLHKAFSVGHPAAYKHKMPPDLQLALDKHWELDESAMARHRTEWCRRWVKRAQELDEAEKQDRAKRPEHIQRATVCKRILLTEEILNSIGYEDMDALELLRLGSPLAGDIPPSAVFERCFKPSLMTLNQLTKEAPKRNQAILSSCSSSGDDSVDRQLLEETREEVKRGWAVGPVVPPAQDCVISRRFHLVQKNKTRMIDD